MAKNMPLLTVTTLVAHGKGIMATSDQAIFGIVAIEMRRIGDVTS